MVSARCSASGMVPQIEVWRGGANWIFLAQYFFSFFLVPYGVCIDGLNDASLFSTMMYGTHFFSVPNKQALTAVAMIVPSCILECRLVHGIWKRGKREQESPRLTCYTATMSLSACTKNSRTFSQPQIFYVTKCSTGKHVGNVFLYFFFEDHTGEKM